MANGMQDLKRINLTVRIVAGADVVPDVSVMSPGPGDEKLVKREAPSPVVGEKNEPNDVVQKQQKQQKV